MKLWPCFDRSVRSHNGSCVGGPDAFARYEERPNGTAERLIVEKLKQEKLINGYVYRY